MKKSVFFISILCLLAFASDMNAQAPQRMNYQGVARNNSGDPITNQMISLRFSVLIGDPSGSSAYTETHTVITNQFGLFSTQLGAGTTVSGNLAAINWQTDSYYLRIEIDPAGGSAYTLLGQPAQLVSVPYALAAQHAHTATNFSGNITMQGDVTGLNNNSSVERLRGRPLAGTPPANGQILRWNGSEWAPTPDNDVQQLQLTGNILSISNANSVTLPISLDAQSLTISGNELTISNGNTVTLPSSIGGTTYTAGSGINIVGGTISNVGDLSNTNELQNMSLNGSQLSLSQGGGSVTLPTGPTYTAGTGISLTGNAVNNTGDLSNTNEIQAISISGDVITLSNGGGTITLPPNSGTDSQTLNVSGGNLSISNGNTVTLPDASSTNEIQAISLAGNTLTLSQGGGNVTLPTGTTYTAGTGISLTGNAITNIGDLSSTNEIQTLAIAGNNLSISGGNDVTLPTGPTYTAGTGISLTGNAVTNTGDLSNTNEIQTVALAGNVLTLSQGGGSVNLPTGPIYTAGTGISLAGNIVTNTGDTNAADDITTSSSAGGDMSGVFANLQIAANAVGNTEIANNAITMPKLAQAGATNGQVIKWNGTAWAPAADATGSGQWVNLTNDTIANANNGPVKTNNQLVVSYLSPNQQIDIPGLVVKNRSPFFPISTRYQREGSGRYWEQSSYTSLGNSYTQFSYFNDTLSNIALRVDRSGSTILNGNFFPNIPYTLVANNITGQDYGINIRNFTQTKNWEITTSSGDLVLFFDNAQRGRFNEVSGQYSAVSDARLKTNIEPMYPVLDKLMQVKAKRYAFKHQDTKEHSQKSLGFMAQDLRPYFPEVVHETKEARSAETLLTVEYGTLSVIALQAIQEQQILIMDLQQNNAALKAQLQALDANQKSLDARLKAIEGKK